MGCTTSSVLEAAEINEVKLAQRYVEKSSRTKVRLPTVSTISTLCSTPSSYTLQEQLGKGSFGTVRAALYPDGESPCAIKMLPIVRKDDPEATTLDVSLLAEAEHEARVWKNIQPHPRVVRLVECFTDDGKFCMVMDKCSGGSLYDFRHTFGTIPETKVAAIFRQMLQGLSHVHSCGVIHRDLKPGNFFLDGAKGDSVKLGDFGLAAVVPSTGEKLMSIVGTAPYMSPEMVCRTGHHLATDVWSLGATCYTLFLGEYPYKSATEAAKKSGRNLDGIKDAIKTGAIPPSFKRVHTRVTEKGGLPVVQPSAESVSFLQACLRRDSQERVTVHEALEHSFFADPGLNYNDSCCEGDLLVAQRMRAAADSLLVSQGETVIIL